MAKRAITSKKFPAPAEELPARRRGYSPLFLAVTIGLHLLLGGGATIWVVQNIQANRKLQFSGGPPVESRAKRAMEHKVSVQKKKNAGGAPSQPKRIAVAGLATNITLPELPAMPVSSGQFVPGSMAGMGTAGFGTGLGFGTGSGMGVGGMGQGGLGLTMFGMRSTADMVIVIDISGSMVQGTKNRKSYDELEEEAIRSVRMLAMGTKFNVITFAKETHIFEKQMVPSSISSLDGAIRWLRSYSPCLLLPQGIDKGNPQVWMSDKGERHTGTSSKLALEAAFTMKPSTIIFVSDGQPTDASPDVILKTVQELQSKLPKKTTINTVAYKADNGQVFLEELAKQNGGQFKNIE